MMEGGLGGEGEEEQEEEEEEGGSEASWQIVAADETSNYYGQVNGIPPPEGIYCALGCEYKRNHLKCGMK